MLTTQEFSGSVVNEYVRRQLHKGDTLALAVLGRLSELPRVFTFVPGDDRLTNPTARDLEQSTTLDIPDSGWLSECRETVTRFLYGFLAAGPFRLALFAVSESEREIARASTRFSRGARRRLIGDRINPRYLYIDEGNSTDRHAYTYVSRNATLDIVRETRWLEQHYPSRTILVDLGSSGKLPKPGQGLDAARVKGFAASTRYLVVGAYDDETSLICEFAGGGKRAASSIAAPSPISL